MRVRLALAFTLALGCNYTFGLSELQPDAQGPRVTGRVIERYIVNDALGAPMVVERAYDPAAIALVVTFDDGTARPVNYHDDGTFDFERERADQPYRLAGTFDGSRGEYQFDVPTLSIARLVAGRPGPTPLQSTYMTFPYPSSATGLRSAQVVSTGLFMSLDSNLFGPSVTVDWKTAVATTGSRAGLLDAREHDRAYVLQMEVDSVTSPGLSYNVVTGASSAEITQIPTRTQTLAGPSPVVRNACAHMLTPNAAVLSRLVTAVPNWSYVYRGGDWHVSGVPAARFFATAAYPLAYASEATALDSELVAPYHDPFPGWTIVADAGVLAGFDIPVPGTPQPLRQYQAVRRYRTIGHGTLSCSQPAESFASTIAIADGIALAGVALDAHDKSVALGEAEPAEVTWTYGAAGDVDFTSVTLFEILPSSTFAGTVALRSVAVLGTRALFDRSLFEPGHLYLFAVTVATGLPGAGSGDLMTVNESFERATTWSHSFSVP